MRHLLSILPVLFAVFIAVNFSGCTSGKRLGESRVEARRFSKGYHVNTSGNAGALAGAVHAHHAGRLVSSEVGAENAWAVTTDEVVLADAGAGVKEHPELWKLTMTESSVDRNAGESHGFWATEASAGSVMPHLNMREDISVGQPSRFVVPDHRSAGALPEAVAGRHPDAILGFVLSLGWVAGGIAAQVLGSLGVSNPAGALTLGFLMTVVGYFLSVRIHRISKAHPELYPRSGMSAAARWIAAFLILLPLLYLTVIVVAVLVFASGLF